MFSSKLDPPAWLKRRIGRPSAYNTRSCSSASTTTRVIAQFLSPFNCSYLLPRPVYSRLHQRVLWAALRVWNLAPKRYRHVSLSPPVAVPHAAKPHWGCFTKARLHQISGSHKSFTSSIFVAFAVLLLLFFFFLCDRPGWPSFLSISCLTLQPARAKDSSGLKVRGGL